jgi:hypothetical protein
VVVAEVAEVVVAEAEAEVVVVVAEVVVAAGVRACRARRVASAVTAPSSSPTG